MGLDSVELILSIEEKFGVEISDEEASRILTVGQMQGLILSKLNLSEERNCLTQQAFHLVRKSATTAFGVSRKALKPDTLLDSFMPRGSRKQDWLKFQSNLGVVQMPELVRPTSVVAIVTSLALVILVTTAWYGALKGPIGTWFLIGVVVAIGVGWAGSKLTEGLKTEFQEGYSRVRDLARYIVARHPELLRRPRSKMWTLEEVKCLLREVIIEQTGEVNFDETSRFVADLHLD